MSLLIVLALLLVAAAGTAVVLTPQPTSQAVTFAVFGLALAVLFVIVQGPDVALSQLGIGSAVVPLMVMLAIRSMETWSREHKDDE